MDRRTLLRRGALAFGAVTLPGLLAACGGSSSESTSSVSPSGELSGTLTVAMYGGLGQEAMSKAFLKPFVKDHPDVKIREDSTSSRTKIKAMVEAGNVIWDIALTGLDFGQDTDGEWLEPIDWNLLDRSVFLEGLPSDYGVPMDVESTVIAYRSDQHKETPTKLADIFDLERFPGKRTAWKVVRSGIMEAALIADGVAPDKLYPIDMPRALKRLDTIRDQLVWYDTAAASQQLLSSGEVGLGLFWNGRVLQVAKDDPAIKVNWGQWLSLGAKWVIPKGSKNVELAMHALKAFSQTEWQYNYAKDFVGTGPAEAKAIEQIKKLKTGVYPTDHLETQVQINYEWWNQNFDAMDKQFQNWLVA